MGEIIDYNTFGAARKFVDEPADPHFIIQASDGIHAIPASVFQQVIDGEITFMEIERWELLLPAIIKDWLRFKMGE